MIRQCVISTTDVQAVQMSDGSWTTEGVEADHFLDTILILERWGKPFNSTFFITLDPRECEKRFANNQSDFSNYLIPLHTVSPYYHAPETVFPGKNQFITGYNTTEDARPGKDSATVFTNVRLLQPAVYLWTLILMITVAIFVTTRIYVHYKAMAQLKPNRVHLVRVTLREVNSVLNHSSDHFKLITFLYAMFSFFLITGFLCIFKTSHVIAERPFYPTSYQESLEHETSLFAHYDQFVVVSSAFKNAPAHSLKRRLWDKMQASGLQERYRVDTESTSPANLPSLMTRFTVAIVFEKFIGVASSITIPLLKSLACGFSPQGQLWFLKVLSDPSEREIIYGYATAHQFPGLKRLKVSLRRAFESHITSHHYDIALEVTHIANKFVDTTKDHRLRQRLACTDEKALIPDVEVNAIPLSYFYSFHFACLGIWTAAFIINLVQIICVRHNRRPRLSRRHRHFTEEQSLPEWL